VSLRSTAGISSEVDRQQGSLSERGKFNTSKGIPVSRPLPNGHRSRPLLRGSPVYHNYRGNALEARLKSPETSVFRGCTPCPIEDGEMRRRCGRGAVVNRLNIAGP
jgi:hypothetical protein